VICLGAKIVAFVLAVVEVGKENEIAQQLREAGVAEVDVVYGEYDLLCKIQTDTIEQLDSAMAQLRKTRGLIRTVTLLGSKRR